MSICLNVLKRFSKSISQLKPGPEMNILPNLQSHFVVWVFMSFLKAVNDSDFLNISR